MDTLQRHFIQKEKLNLHANTVNKEVGEMEVHSSINEPGLNDCVGLDGERQKHSPDLVLLLGNVYASALPYLTLWISEAPPSK